MRFDLKREDLSIYDEDMNFTLEPGTFRVMVGASSDDIRLSGDFTI